MNTWECETETGVPDVGETRRSRLSLRQSTLDSNKTNTRLSGVLGLAGTEPDGP